MGSGKDVFAKLSGSEALGTRVPACTELCPSPVRDRGMADDWVAAVAGADGGGIYAPVSWRSCAAMEVVRSHATPRQYAEFANFNRTESTASRFNGKTWRNARVCRGQVVRNKLWPSEKRDSERLTSKMLCSTTNENTSGEAEGRKWSSQ